MKTKSAVLKRAEWEKVDLFKDIELAALISRLQTHCHWGTKRIRKALLRRRINKEELEIHELGRYHRSHEHKQDDYTMLSISADGSRGDVQPQLSSRESNVHE